MQFNVLNEPSRDFFQNGINVVNATVVDVNCCKVIISANHLEYYKSNAECFCDGIVENSIQPTQIRCLRASIEPSSKFSKSVLRVYLRIRVLLQALRFLY